MSEMPQPIENYARQVETLEREKRGRYTYEEKRRLAIAKLNVAVWACRAEGIPLSRFALTEILGPDTQFVFLHAANEMLELPWEDPQDRAAAIKAAAAQSPTRQEKSKKALNHVYR